MCIEGFWKFNKMFLKYTVLRCVFLVSKFNQNSTSKESSYCWPWVSRWDLYYSSLGSLKHETALLQKITALRKLLLLVFHMFCIVRGSTNQKALGSSCKLSMSASLQRAERENVQKSGKLENSWWILPQLVLCENAQESFTKQ